MINWLDIVLGVILIAAALTGLIKGLVREVIGLAVIIVGIFLAGHYHPAVAKFVGRFISNPTVAGFLGFLFIFIVVLTAGGLVAGLVSKLVNASLGLVNHLVGAAIGLVEGAFICGALVFALLAFPISKDAVANSKLAPTCYTVTKTVISLIPQNLKDQIKTTYDSLSKSEKKHGQEV